jgi:uncharacterized protein (TIGR02594 family)
VNIIERPTFASPPWMATAWSQLGVREVPGERHHPQVLVYHKATTLGAAADEVPWCSAAVCWVLEQCKIPSTRSAGARSWLKWGIGLNEPCYGCIVVFDRSSKAQPKAGHVGFYIDRTKDSVVVLGGNQGNEVRVSLYPAKKVLGYRWPQ